MVEPDPAASAVNTHQLTIANTWLISQFIILYVCSIDSFSAEKYVREVVNEGGTEDEVVDSDGEVLGFEGLVFAIFEFVHALVETKKFRGAVKSGLADLMYYIVLYMQITGEYWLTSDTRICYQGSVSDPDLGQKGKEWINHNFVE